MTQFKLIVTIFCIKLYAIYATPTPTDQTPQHTIDLYDSTQMSEEFDPIIEQQPLTAYHDLILTNDKEYYIPHSLVTVSAKRTPYQNNDEFNDDQHHLNSDNDNNKQTSTESIAVSANDDDDNHLTTIILDNNSNISDLADVNGKETKMENSSNTQHNIDDIESLSPLLMETFETAAASKHSKMFIPAADEYDTSDVHILPVFIENAIQSSEQLISHRNDTIDDEDADDGDEDSSSSIDNIENEDSELELNTSDTLITTTDEESTNMPTTTSTSTPTTTTQIIYKKAKSIPTTATTSSTTTATTTTTTTTTTARPTTTTPTRSHIYKFSADEILRKFLEDSYIRSPLAVLIDTSPNSLRKSKRLWKAALRPNSAVDIVLVAYNSTGKRFSIMLLLFLKSVVYRIQMSNVNCRYTDTSQISFTFPV